MFYMYCIILFCYYSCLLVNAIFMFSFSTVNVQIYNALNWCTLKKFKNLEQTVLQSYGSLSVFAKASSTGDFSSCKVLSNGSGRKQRLKSVSTPVNTLQCVALYKFCVRVVVVNAVSDLHRKELSADNILLERDLHRRSRTREHFCVSMYRVCFMSMDCILMCMCEV
jgi:hypothetical protein